jgi:hypothetical protein
MMIAFVMRQVKYDPADKASELYKMYMTAFSHSMPEQWLKFMENLNVIIHDNGLDKNGRACFNLTRSSLNPTVKSILPNIHTKRSASSPIQHDLCLPSFSKFIPEISQHFFIQLHPIIFLFQK